MQPISKRWLLLPAVLLLIVFGYSLQQSNGLVDHGANTAAPALGAPRVGALMLYNSRTNQPLFPLTEGARLDLADPAIGNKLAIKAEIVAGSAWTTKSVNFRTDVYNHFENIPPYFFPNDNSGDPGDYTPRVGDHRIVVTPYSDSNGHGLNGFPLTVNFTVLGSNVPGGGSSAVSSFTLMNSANDTVIGVIDEGEVINLSDPTVGSRLNIRADVTGTLESVRFNSTGAETSTLTENDAPYAFKGDSNGNYANWTPRVGSYRLVATPYSRNGAAGQAGQALTRNFSVISGTVGNTPPIANAGPDQTLVGPVVTARLNGLASADPDGGQLQAYAWEGPVGITFPRSIPQPAVNFSAAGSYSFSLRVQDDEGDWSATADTVVINVSGTAPNCGNGGIDSGEQCDGTDLNDRTCSNLGQGFTGGTLSCFQTGSANQCRFNTSQCTGAVEPPAGGVVYVDLIPAACTTYDLNTRRCGNGTLQAYPSVQAAAAVVRAGTTIYVRAGTYTDKWIRFANSGTPGAPITVAGYPGDASKPIIQTSTERTSWNIFSFDVTGNADGKSNYVIKDLVLRNARAAVAVWGDDSHQTRMTDIRLENLDISNASVGISVGKSGSVDRMLVQNVHMSHIAGTEGGLEFGVNGVACEAGTGARNVVIRDSSSEDNYHTQAAGFLAQETSENIIWINNEAHNNGEQCIASKAGGHNIYIGNYCYDNPASSYYLHGPRKSFSCGLVNGEMSNYLLLNNVGLNTTDSVSNQSRFRAAQPVAKILLYNNTGIAMKKRPACFGESGGGCPRDNAVLSSLTLGSGDFLVPGEHRYIYSFNNLYLQAQNWSADPAVEMGSDTAQNRIFFTSVGDGVGTGNGTGFSWFRNFNPDDSTVAQDLRLTRANPATPMDLSNPMHYVNQIREFLAPYSPDNNPSNAFNHFSILSQSEKQELRDFINNAYRYDADGNARGTQADVGAYEYAN